MPARPWSIELMTAQVVKPAAAVPPKEPTSSVERWVIWQVLGFDVFIVFVEIDSYSYDSWFFHAWEHLRIILTGFMKEREREWVGMSYFIPCRDCGCMESRNTHSLDVAPDRKPPPPSLSPSTSSWSRKIGHSRSTDLPPLVQQLGRWFPGVLCRVQEAGEFLNGPWLQPDKNLDRSDDHWWGADAASDLKADEVM